MHNNHNFFPNNYNNLQFNNECINNEYNKKKNKLNNN